MTDNVDDIAVDDHLPYRPNPSPRLAMPETAAESEVAEAAEEVVKEEIEATTGEATTNAPLVSPKKKTKFGYFHAILLGVALALVLNVFFLESYVVPSESMYPTLQSGDYMVSIPLVDNRTPPDRGDIVVFDTPNEWTNVPDVYVKRVIGVAGDTVAYDPIKDEFTVNNAVPDEPYIKQWDKYSFLDNEGWSYTVPEGMLFMMGDNRDNSLDSRYYPGSPFVPVENVRGQPFLITWPLDRIGAL